MTKSGRGKKHRHDSRRSEEKVSDLGPYVGFLLIWIFAGFLLYLVAPDFATARFLTMGVGAGFFLYVTLCTVYACLGRKLMGWQRGLVRLPLILVGAGKRPVASVKGSMAAVLAIVAALVISLVLIALTVWLA